MTIQKKIRVGRFQRTLAGLLAAIFVSVVVSAPVYALTANQKNVLQLGILYFNTEVSPVCSAAANSAGAGSVSTSASQADIAKIIIGIAKTDNIGRAGALIGLMVGITESKLQIYANTNVPISLSNPAKQAVGSDHDSLGVFQQRISTDWSTISSSPNNKDAVYQLMDPAYSAEAFFGSPPNTVAQPELTKGLQNVSGWQSQNPWVAAQAVQASGTPDGSNYKVSMPQAQSLLNQYWDSAPAIPLPITQRGGSGSSTGGGVSLSNSTCTANSAECSGAASTSSNLSPVRQSVVCIAQAELALWKSGKLTPGTSFHKYSQGRDENWCADFASWVYNQANDPLTDSGQDGNVPAVSSIRKIGQAGGKFHWHAVRGYTPRPGDLVIHENGASHVNIVTAVNGSSYTVIGGNQTTYNFHTSDVSQYDISSSNDQDVTGFVSPD